MFGDTRMLTWLKQKVTGSGESWLRVQQEPGTTFPFPKGAKLRPDEEVVLALPAALFSDHEEIGSVLLCDDNAGLAWDEKAGAWYVKLKPGMTFSLARSCEVMLIASGHRPRFFHYLAPEKKTTEPGASPNGGPARRPGNSAGTEGPPSVS